jgi:hypothetical protein
MPTQPDSSEIARSELQTILTALGFTPPQMARLLEQGVTAEQLRGMLQLRRCEGGPAAVLADIAARIDRIEELERTTY